MKTAISITPSDVIEYLYCPRFIYFMHCLCIDQHEENRYKVTKGRDVHKLKSSTNKDYLRKKLDVISKEIDIPVNSQKYNLHGIVDEVLFKSDGTLAPFDYKYAEYKEQLFTTYKYQSYMYAMMLMDHYKQEAKVGYICYIRSNNLVKEIYYTKEGFKEVLSLVNETIKIIETGFFPKKTKTASRCIDCCYRNICVK